MAIQDFRPISSVALVHRLVAHEISGVQLMSVNQSAWLSSCYLQLPKYLNLSAFQGWEVSTQTESIGKP